MKLEFSWQFFFEKFSNIKFDEDVPSGSRVFPCGQTDMMKLIVAFRNFVNAPINIYQKYSAQGSTDKNTHKKMLENPEGV